MISGAGTRAARITLPQIIPVCASFIRYLSLRVDNPTSTSIIVIIQKPGMISGVGTRAARITLPQIIPVCASFIRYLSLRVDNPTSTSIIVIIQKRTTT